MSNSCRVESRPGAVKNDSRTAAGDAILHLKCIQIGERAEGDITDVVPHRAWTWQQDFEKSRQLLDQVRHDLTELRGTEVEFEASLNSEQQAKAQPLIKSLQGLLKHLESDAQSLDSELLKGYPTRWHVARDAFDMQKEIHRWNELHNQVAAKLQL